MRQLWTYGHTQLEDEMWAGSLLEVRQHLPRAETHQISSRIQRAERDNSRERCEGDIKGSHWVKNPTVHRGTNKFKGAFTPGCSETTGLYTFGSVYKFEYIIITFWCRMLTESRLSQLFGGGLGSIPFQAKSSSFTVWTQPNQQREPIAFICAAGQKGPKDWSSKWTIQYQTLHVTLFDCWLWVFSPSLSFFHLGFYKHHCFY